MLFLISGNEGRRLRRPFFVAVLLALSGVGVLQSAHAATRGFIVTSFDSIRVEAPVRVVLTAGGGAKGEGEGDREALDRVSLSVSGGLLTVRMADRPESGFSDANPVEAPTIRLSTGRLRRVMVLGGGIVTIKGLSGLDADLSMNGNGEMFVEQADVEQLNLFVGGGGRMTISGTARDVRASVNGPGAMDAAALVAKAATISNDGPGLIRITVNGPAEVTSTGSGDTYIEGNPVCSVTRRGVGRVICEGR